MLIYFVNLHNQSDSRGRIKKAEDKHVCLPLSPKSETHHVLSP